MNGAPNSKKIKRQNSQHVKDTAHVDYDARLRDVKRKKNE